MIEQIIGEGLVNAREDIFYEQDKKTNMCDFGVCLSFI